MARAELADAAERLEVAADASGHDASAERLSGLAEQLDSLATADRGPDHGRLARIQSAMAEVSEDADAAVREEIDLADERIDDFRETLEGV